MAVLSDNVDGSLSMDSAALYLVEERLETFKVEHCSWPFDSGPCTPTKMAEAGFYYCGTSQAPDWVRCIVCHHDMEGWESEDDPREEHKRHQPKCAFLKIKDPYAITVGQVLDLEKAAMENFINMEALKLESDLKAYVAEIRQELENVIQKGSEP